MRKFIISIVAVIAVAGSSMATASSFWNHHSYGVWCMSSAEVRGVMCVKDDGTGYGVGISENFVIVTKGGRRVFSRYH